MVNITVKMNVMQGWSNKLLVQIIFGVDFALCKRHYQADVKTVNLSTKYLSTLDPLIFMMLFTKKNNN